MGNDFPGDAAKTVWQNQPTENKTMTLKLIEHKSRELRVRTRRKLIGTAAGPLAVGLVYGIGVQQFVGLREFLHPLFAFALAWSIAGVFFLNRGMWPAVRQEEMGIRTGLQFCRQEIERQRDIDRRVLVWSFGPVMLTLGTFILALAMVGMKGRGIFPNGFPFLALVVVWIVSYFVIRWREQRDLQRQLDELNDVEKGN